MSTAASHAEHSTELQPTLGWFSAAAIAAGSMIGSGIFIVPADIGRTMGTAGLMMAVWIFSGILTLLGATSYSKLAGYMPRAGGQYVFLKEAWGEIPAFLYGWALLLVIQTGFLAAVAVAFTKFLGVLVPEVTAEPSFFIGGLGISIQQMLAIAVLFLLTLYNSTGVKNGAILQNIFTVLKVLSLILLIAVGFLFGKNLWGGGTPIDWSLSLPAGHTVPGNLMTLFAFASVGALFSSDAWNYATFIGGEMKEAKKDLPKALIIGTTVVVVVYLLANLAYLNLLTMDQIQHAPEDRVATVAMAQVFSGGFISAPTLMALIILVSTFGCLNGMLLAGARVFYAMAKDGLLFHKFAETHPKTHSPNFSMWMQFIWASLLALSGTYSKLLDYIVFTSLVFYIVTMLGLIRLGKRIPEEVKMTRPVDSLIPWAYIVGATFIAFFLLFGDFMTGDTTILRTQFTQSKFFSSIAGLGLTALGLPVYYLWKRRKAAAV